MSTNDPNTPARPESLVPAPSPSVPARVTVPAPSPMSKFLLPGAGFVIAVVLWALFSPRANPSERLATRVTVAIVNNDMRPVENDFNAIPREQLKNRAKVGMLSTDLNELGKLKAIKEDTPSTAATGYHHFAAQFEKGTWEEDMTYDSVGKIRSFHVHAPAANITR